MVGEDQCCLILIPIDSAGNWVLNNVVLDCSEVLLLHLVVDQWHYRALTGSVGNVALARCGSMQQILNWLLDAFQHV